MTTGTNTRVPPPTLSTDRSALLALQALGDYVPLNPAYSAAALQQLEAALLQAETAEILARRALEVAREQVVEAGQIFHRAIMGAKAQVIAQYGDDSPAVHAVGRKQRSERRRPARRAVRQPQA